MSETISKINATLARLREAEFKCDPLFSPNDSFEMSLRTSAIKRHGAIIESAIVEVIDSESPNCKAFYVPLGEYCREIDVFCVDHAAKKILAFDVKRGNSYHDSGKKRDMASTSKVILAEIRAKFQGYKVRFGYLHYYSDTDNHVEPISIADVRRFTGVDVRKAVDAASREFSRGLDEIIRERVYG